MVFPTNSGYIVIFIANFICVADIKQLVCPVSCVSSKSFTIMKNRTITIRTSSVFPALVGGILIILAAAFSGFAYDNPIPDSIGVSTFSVLGPNGGDVRDIAIDPKDKDRLYISTLDGQLFTSADGGKSWKLFVNLNEPQLILDNVMVDISDSKRIYTSGHRYKSAGGFFYTTDGGATWKEAKDLAKESIQAMAQSEFDPKTLTVGALSGVWISKDSGETWTKTDSASMPLNVNSMAVDPRNTSTIYAGTAWRPYKSTDSGKSWNLIKTGMIDDSDVFAITINDENPEHIIASACSGIYESFNGGERWAKIQGIPSQSRRTRSIVQHPTKPGVIYAGTTEGFWMSTNGGKSWSLTTQRNLEINSVVVHPAAPDRVYIGTNNFGVMVSNDGGRNFVQTNNDFSNRFTYSITADIEQPNRLYATTQNTATSGGFFFTSSDGGNTWIQAKNLDIARVSPFAVLQDKLTPTTLYLGTNMGIYRSTDRGMMWNYLESPKPVKKAPARRTKGKKAPAKPVETGPKLLPALAEKVRVLAYTDDDKNGMFAGTASGLYRTYDISKGWEKLDFGPGIDPNVFVIHTSPLVPGTIWVGTASSGVIVSTDDGETWMKLNATPENVPISSIASDPKLPNNIYVGTTQSFYLSRDGGRTWKRRGGNLPMGNYSSILIDPNDPREIFISSSFEKDGGIFYSTDSGENWNRLDSKSMHLPSYRVWSMVFDPADPSKIFAGTHSGGVYRIDRLEPKVEETAAATVVQK